MSACPTVGACAALALAGLTCGEEEKKSEMMETRRIVCNACGADRFAALSSVDEWTIGRCGACGLVYVNPAPFFEPTDEFSDVSRAFEYTEYMHQPVTEAILAFERRQLQANSAIISGFGSGSADPARRVRFLDIGCGSGASVRAALDLGWEALGIDIDPQLIREGREQLDVDLRCVPILECGLPSGYFDFVKLRDVVEHLPNPFEVLVKVGELLAPGGVSLIVTPNEGGLATRVRGTLRRRRSLVATVPPPHHLHSFAPGSLMRTMRRAGLEPRTTFTTMPTDWRYVTSHNMARARSQPLLRPLWRVGRATGMGAVLVSWAQRQQG
jgi:2-polyprenyl-3-methyl-5-hydroxy-6-metoxy-1,4-benzoquinol methylase